MEKKVIKQDKTTIVILKDANYYPEIVAKGIATCDERDEYNEELGEKIANAKAWVKYYDKLAKRSNDYVDWLNGVIESRIHDLKRQEATYQYAIEKGARIASELEELVKED